MCRNLLTGTPEPGSVSVSLSAEEVEVSEVTRPVHHHTQLGGSDSGDSLRPQSYLPALYLPTNRLSVT